MLVPAPIDRARVLAEREALAALGLRLGSIGFVPARVHAYLGANAVGAIPHILASERMRQARAEHTPTGLGALIELLVCGRPASRGEIAALLGEAETVLLERVGVLAASAGVLTPRIVILPVGRVLGRGTGPRALTTASVLCAHDLHEASGERDAVMPPDVSSEMLLRAAPIRRGAWLDVGSGSGVMALHAARRGAAPVVAADVNARAAAFVELGAALTGCEVTAVTADLTRGVPAGRYDVVTFNVPLLFGEIGAALWKHAPEGEALLDRFLGELPSVLAEDARAEALLHCEFRLDNRLLIDRAAALAPREAWKILRIRYYEEDFYSQGLLWIARAAEPKLAFAAEVLVDTLVAEPFLDRELVDRLVGQAEMGSHSRA